MKILYCNKYNYRFSGTEAYLFDAMEGMRACGHDVALFSMADPRGVASDFDAHLPASVDFNAGNAFSKMRLAGHAIYSFAAKRKMRNMVHAFRPDVAHVRNIYHHLSPSILWELRRNDVPVIYHVNDFKLLCPAYNLVSASGDACERCAGGKFRHVVTCGCYAGGRTAAAVLAAEAYLHRWLKTYDACVDLILAPSEFVREKLIESGWKASRVQVLQHFQELPSRTRPHPGASAPIVYFGRLSAEKGLRELIEAMACLPHLQLMIAGEGPQRHDLETLVSSMKLGNVTFKGYMQGSALEELIGLSQFTIFPSRAYETFGKSILESYAQARAVIASDLGSRRELVEHGRTGLLYRVKDVNELTAAIRFLAEHPELSRQMGEAGWRVARDRHSREEHFLALTAIYQGLVQERQSHSTSSARRLRVAMIGGRGVGGKYSGVETYCEQTGARLSRQGHDVTVYCRSYFTPGMLDYHGIRVIRVPTIRTKHLDTLVHTFLSTIHACFARYDVVHYQTLGPSMFSFLPRLFGIKTAVTVQGLDWKRKKWSRVASRFLKIGEWASARLPNKTVCVSHTLERYFAARYNKPIIYVPNGTELRDRSSGGLLKSFGLEPDGYALFLGRLSPEKNCDLLIKAFEGISTSKKLVFAGGASHSDEYASALRSHASPRVVFLDWLAGEALDAVLTHAAVFVLPSDLEGMSLALLDAMGAGVCVLASDIAENRETIGDAGFTFRTGDVSDLRGMLALLLSDDVIRSVVAEKARKRVRENYLWEDVTRKIEQIYLELSDPPRKDRAYDVVNRGNRKRIQRSETGISTSHLQNRVR